MPEQVVVSIFFSMRGPLLILAPMAPWGPSSWALPKARDVIGLRFIRLGRKGVHVPETPLAWDRRH